MGKGWMEGYFTHVLEYTLAHTHTHKQLPQTYSGLKSRIQGRERRKGRKEREGKGGRRKEEMTGLLFRINHQDQGRGGHPHGLQRH